MAPTAVSVIIMTITVKAFLREPKTREELNTTGRFSLLPPSLPGGMGTTTYDKAFQFSQSFRAHWDKWISLKEMANILSKMYSRSWKKALRVKQL